MLEAVAEISALARLLFYTFISAQTMLEPTRRTLARLFDSIAPTLVYRQRLRIVSNRQPLL